MFRRTSALIPGTVPLVFQRFVLFGASISQKGAMRFPRRSLLAWTSIHPNRPSALDKPQDLPAQSQFLPAQSRTLGTCRSSRASRPCGKSGRYGSFVFRDRKAANERSRMDGFRCRKKLASVPGWGLRILVQRRPRDLVARREFAIDTQDKLVFSSERQRQRFE